MPFFFPLGLLFFPSDRLLFFARDMNTTKRPHSPTLFFPLNEPSLAVAGRDDREAPSLEVFPPLLITA